MISETSDQMVGGFELLVKFEVLPFELLFFGRGIEVKFSGFIEHVLFESQ